ncbi:MAG: hypothetical protein HC836_23190 [Richelia sp. RM2_1_2]|nr:hypothetical protein [Richelia sp. RM2_1_2]
MSVIIHITDTNLFSNKYNNNGRPFKTSSDFAFKKEIWNWARDNSVKMRKIKITDLPKYSSKETVRITIDPRLLPGLLTGLSVDIDTLQKLPKSNGPWWQGLVFKHEEDAVLFKLRWL